MKRNFIMGSIIVLFILIVSSYTIFFRSQQPLVQAQREAKKIAEEVADIHRIQDFYWYNGVKETYFTVEGYTKDNKHLYVVIKQNGGDTLLLDAEKVVTEEEAKSILQAEKNPQKILEARIGIEETVPFWEIAYENHDGSMSYLLLSVQTGETIREYNDI